MKTDSLLTRRAFLEKTTAVATAAGLIRGVPGMGEPAGADPAHAWPENGTLVPDEGWTLWVDEKAEWKQDRIYLPEDVRPGGPGDMATLPVNAPSGGWGVIEGQAPGSIGVTLPGTVEQHFWGKYGAGEDGKARSYTPEEYRYAAGVNRADNDDPVPQNGAYFGVSWWYRKIAIPAEMKGKRIFLHVRGAHLRAEVYCNRKLVGYSIMEELPFEAELTAAAVPGGENMLAIRITNPFGRFDWVDGLNAQWGAVKLYRSHGFGGLDRGITVSAHSAAVRIKDLWVLNGEEPGQIYMRSSTEVVLGEQARGYLLHEIIDPADGKRYTGMKTPAETHGAGVIEHDAGMTITPSAATLWDLSSPKLFHLRTTWIGDDGRSDSRTVAFGFRKFGPEGLGKDAMFRLNGRRVKIYTAISWGFWGINGMWPTPELAEKEVTQAQKLGLNCLNFHRNLAKEDVLRAHDRLGMLRYMEPGAGKMAIGKLPAAVQANSAGIVMEKPTSEADKFAQRYMFVKCVEMVKAFRSHPSVIEYCLQNEIGADLKNPDTLAVLAAMRAEDPSRCIVLNDGFVAPPRNAAQAWYEPWNEKLHRSDEEEFGGWWNQHQGAGDQWYDEFYKSPTELTYGAPPGLKGIITEYGEMEGCATPDNHSKMLAQYADPARGGIGRQPANHSYDLKDHQEIVAAYDRFLDRWGFRKAFPATEQLWLSIGKKCYDTWQNYMENARISNELDFCAISGWESTSIENHSGIVDNLRNFKSDPGPISGTLMPVRPVAKQRAICSSFDQDAVFDIYLLNDTGKPVSGELVFSVIDPKNHITQIARYPVPAQTPDQFSYLVKEDVRYRPKRNATVPYGFEGMYRFKLELTSHALATQTKEIWITFKKEFPSGELFAVSGISPSLRKQLEATGEMIEDFRAGQKYAGIISSGMKRGVNSKQESGDTTGLEAQVGNEVGPTHTTEQVGEIDPAVLEAVRAGTPLLAIPQADTLSEGVAKQLAAAGAFEYHGTVGDFRAPWMGNWYFVREHAVYAGMPVNQAMGIHYAAKGRQSNGLLVEGPAVEIIAAYSRDHDRRIGAGTFTTMLGKGRVLYQRVPDLHPVMQARFMANALGWLAAAKG